MTTTPPASPYAVAGLLLGASAIGLAPILVRLSEIGPVATAFQRLFLALPALALWAWWSKPKPAEDSRAPQAGKWIVLAGAFFAADLAVWHWSITLTSVANATLLANLAPILVMLGAWLLFREQVTRRFVLALAVALVGVALLMGERLHYVRAQLVGDALGVLTAAFYAGYLLTVARLRRRVSTAAIMLGSSATGAALLLPLAVASGENLWPASAPGWVVLATLALVSHVAGQGLITWALAHLPASYGSVTLLWQPVAAAGLAWVLLAEPMGALQVIGAALVLIGIVLVRRAKNLRS